MKKLMMIVLVIGLSACSGGASQAEKDLEASEIFLNSKKKLMTCRGIMKHCKQNVDQKESELKHWKKSSKKASRLKTQKKTKSKGVLTCMKRNFI